MSSYLIRLWIPVDEQCHIASCGGESDNIDEAFKSIRANLGAFFTRSLWFGVWCELTLIPFDEAIKKMGEFQGGI